MAFYAPQVAYQLKNQDEADSPVLVFFVRHPIFEAILIFTICCGLLWIWDRLFPEQHFNAALHNAQQMQHHHHRHVRVVRRGVFDFFHVFPRRLIRTGAIHVVTILVLLFNFFISTVQCSACVGYSCANMDKVDADGLPNNLIAAGGGCPENFFHDCANFTKEIEFIKSHNEKNLDYTNAYVTYISGCENEQDGISCIVSKGLRFEKQLKPIKDFKLGEIIWNSEDGTTHRLDASGAEIKNPGSKNQNDALKFIGIFAFTWILFSFM